MSQMGIHTYKDDMNLNMNQLIAFVNKMLFYLKNCIYK